MNFDDILGKLMPLFEQKVAFTMAMSERTMSLEEKKEASKTDLEYRKLEAQITTDKDKLKWEKEKLSTAIKGDYDLQTLKNSGIIDSERLKGLTELEKQKLMEEGANSRNKYTADSTAKTAYLTTLGTVLGHALEKTGTDAEGKSYSQKPTSEVGTAARSLMEQTGLVRPAETRNVAGEAAVAAGVLREHQKNGTTDAARDYLNALPDDTRQATLALLNPGSTATPPVAPVRPTTIQPTALPSAVQPAAQPVTDASRPILQPRVPGAEWQGLNPEMGKVVKPPRLYDSGVMGDPNTFGSAKRDFITVSDPEAEKKRQEALRRARGLTVGGL